MLPDIMTWSVLFSPIWM